MPNRSGKYEASRSRLHSERLHDVNLKRLYILEDRIDPSANMGLVLFLGVGTPTLASRTPLGGPPLRCLLLQLRPPLDLLSSLDLRCLLLYLR